jgi:acyl-coenzyme A synthetase/AMP-(fatty) acid ligase
MNFIAARIPDGTALIFEDGGRCSYAALEREVADFQAVFPECGVVFCLCNNDLPSLRIYLAGLEGAAVALLLPGTIQQDRLEALIAAYCPRYLFHARPDLHITGYDSVLWQGDGYILRATKHPKPYKLHPDLALLLATSGSTGSPKLVRLSRRNLEANADAIMDYLGIDTSERAITSLPIHYSYGLSVLNSHLRAGASVVLTDRSLMDAEYWRLIQRHAVTSFAGVPYSYEMLLKLRIERLNIPTVKTMTQAGGRLSPDKIRLVAEACTKKGIRFFTMYGQTEATARISYLPCARTTEKAGSIGVAIPAGRLWIEDENGQPIKHPDVTGQLVYAGPNVSLGYAHSWRDLATGDVNQGILRTGDLAMFDAQGYFSIVGRMGRFVKLYGIRISLDAVEKLLAQQGLESAVAGDDDQLHVFLAHTPDVDTEAVRDALAATLVVNKAGITVTRIDALPRLDNGKVDYKILAGISIPP